MRLFDTELPPKDEALLNAINERYFTSPRVVPVIGLEGQRVTERAVELGLRAGPSLTIEALLHEMAHLVEIDDQRCTSHGWGFNYGKEVVVAGQSFFEFSNDASVRRELRVWAFQYALGTAVGAYEGFDAYAAEVGDTARHLALSALCHFLGRLGLEDGPFDFRVKVGVVAELRRLTQDESYSAAAFDKEWNRKLALIEAHFERK